MPHSFPDNIDMQCKWNKVIKLGKRTKEQRLQGLDFKASRARTTQYGISKYGIDGKVLDKPIQVYRMWYRFLQLALELEQQKVTIVTKMVEVPLKKPTKDVYGHLRYSTLKPIKKKVSVSKTAYKKWSLDIIPTTSFDDWWEGNRKKEITAHRELFYPDSTISVLKNKEQWVDNSNFEYLRIDKRRRIADVLADIRTHLSKKDTKQVSVSDFPVIGNPNINTLINRYNALVLQLTSKMTDLAMFKSGIFRPTTYGMDDSDDAVGVYKIGSSAGRTMRSLMLPAKITLLSVCDGYFVKHPTKDYLK